MNKKTESSNLVVAASAVTIGWTHLTNWRLPRGFDVRDPQTNASSWYRQNSVHSGDSCWATDWFDIWRFGGTGRAYFVTSWCERHCQQQKRSSSSSSESSSWILDFTVSSPHAQLIVFIVNALQVIAADLHSALARCFQFFQSPSASVSELCSSPLLSSLSSAAVAAKTLENLLRIFVRRFLLIMLIFFARSCAHLYQSWLGGSKAMDSTFGNLGFESRCHPEEWRPIHA